MKRLEYENGRYKTGINKSCYFPANKRHILQQAVEMDRDMKNKGINEIVQDALELWIDRNWSGYLDKTLRIATND
jgi:hypothetical protein